MTPAGFVTKSIEIERKVGDLYAEFAFRLAHDEEVSSLFSDISEEEYGHARALELVLRLLRGFKGKLLVNPAFEGMAEAVLRDLNRAIEMMKEGRQITTATALSMAIKIESGYIEEQQPSLFESDSPELLKTFRTLGEETGQHKKRFSEMYIKKCVQE